jgi:O-antigen ligase
MHYSGIETQVDEVPASSITHILAWVRERATTANLAGLCGGLLALACLYLLHDPWNLRIPLYLTVAIWTILRPRVALYLMPIAVPWGSADQLNLGGLNLTSADILVGLLAASWLMSFTLRPYLARIAIPGSLLDRETAAIPRYLAIVTVIMLVTMFISMTGALSIKESLKEIAKWLELLIVVLIGAQYLKTRRQIWTLVVMSCLAAISQAIYGYIQYFFNIGPQAFIRDASLRVYGTFDQPNPYAGYINMTLAVTLSLTLLSKNAKTRILAGITTLLLAVAEILSQSRGGEIALAVVLLLIVTVGIPWIRKFIAFGAVAGLFIIAGYLAGIVPQHFVNPILQLLGLTQISFASPSPQDYSTAERLAHWYAGIQMFLTHPFTGVGIGNYPDAYPQYYITIFVNSLGHAHNYYINTAAETGVIGLMAFLFFLLALFVAGTRAYCAINQRYLQLKKQCSHPPVGTDEVQTMRSLTRIQMLTDDRALALGFLAALVSVCTHNLVDDLYVHSMTILFALLLIALIRLEGVMHNVGSNGGQVDY